MLQREIAQRQHHSRNPRQNGERAKRKNIFHDVIRDGIVLLHATDSNGKPMSMEDIYALSEEFALV
jgi:hypothetical protein